MGLKVTLPPCLQGALPCCCITFSCSIRDDLLLRKGHSCEHNIYGAWSISISPRVVQWRAKKSGMHSFCCGGSYSAVAEGNAPTDVEPADSLLQIGLVTVRLVSRVSPVVLPHMRVCAVYCDLYNRHTRCSFTVSHRLLGQLMALQ